MDNSELKKLEEWARQQGCTKSQAVRMAIRALTRSREKEPLLAASGMIDGLPEDVSENLDRYLEDTFVAEKRQSNRRRRRRTK